MAAFIRKQFVGAAEPTTTTSLLSNVGTSVTIAGTLGWPSSASVPFYVVIEAGTAREEKCLATISGTTLTLTRAQDDTTAYEHAIGSTIYPVFTANDADEANEVASKLTTKGDLLVTTGTSLERLPVGSNGTFLKANSSASVGAEWSGITLGTDTSGNYMSDVTAGTGVFVTHTPGEGSSAAISIGQQVGTTDSVTFAGATIDAIKIGVTTANTIDTNSGNLTIDSAGGTVTVDDNLSVTGNLTVSGSVTYVNTQVLQVGDNIITLNSDETGEPSQNAGIEIERGLQPNVLLQYNESSEQWELTNNGSSYSPIETSSAVITRLNQQLWLNTVYAATAAVLPNSPSYTPGSSDLNGGTGIGAKLTATTNGVLQIDGGSIPLNDRVLIKNQANSLHNGIYKVTDAGSSVSPWELTRAADFNNSTYGQTTYGKSVRVATGSVNALQSFSVTSYGSVALGDLSGMIHVIGSDPITWTQVSGKATLIPGNGLEITNNTLSLPTISQSNTSSVSGASNFVQGVNVDSYGRVVGVVTNDAQIELGANTLGNYVESISASAGTGITVSGTGEGATVLIGTNAASSNTASAIVIRDGYGNFSAGTITAELSGNASTANHLYATKSIGLTGDLSGSVMFDGSQDVVISATIQPNSVALGTDTTGNYVNNVVAGTGISVTHTQGEGSSASVALNATLDNLSDVTVPSPTSGDFLKWNGTAWVNDPIDLGTDTVGNYMSDLTAGSGISVTHTPGEGSSASVSLNASLNDLSDVTVSAPEEFQSLSYDGSGWVQSYAPVVSYVRNVEATTLTTGTAVYLFGGTGDKATVKRADNSAESTSSRTVGLVANPITASNSGPVVTRGYVDGVDTQAFNAGDALWLGTNGQITTTKPSAPNHLVYIGVVVRANSNGIVYVAAQNGYELEELHNVKINGVTDGQFLRYSSASTVWIADTIDLGTDTSGDYVQSLVAGTGITLSNNSGESATPTIAIGQDISSSASPTFATLNINGNLVFEGATDDAYETTLTVVDPTADRTITIPNVNGTIVTTGDSGTVTSTMIADGTIVNVDINASAAIDKTKISGTAITAADTGTVTSAMIADGTIVNDDISSSAAIAYSKLANASAGQVLLGTTTTGVITATTLSGDVTVSGAGVTAIGSGVIVNADVNASAAIAHSKLANASAGQVLLGTTTTGVVTATTVSGDVTINGAGVTAIGSGVIVDADINASAAIADTKLATISTTDKVSLSAINIDGGTDIGTALADADLVIVDDGGAGTNRKAAVTRISDYVFGKVSGDVTIASNGAATIAANSVTLGTDTTGNYVSSLVAGTGVTLSNNTGESATPTVAIGQDVSTSSSVTFAQLTTTGSVIIGGNLSVSGSVTTINQTSLAIDDPLIYMNNGSTITDPDLGIAGNYNDGTYAHTGVFSDASDGHKWKFFKGLTVEPVSPINTAHASYAAADVEGRTFSSTVATGTAPLSVSSSTVVTNLNADKLDGQDGTYYAPLASPTFTGTVTLPTGTVTSGMILDGTIVNADINASASIALTKLASDTTTALGVGTIELGHASDTTIARSSAGVVTIEGVQVDTISGSATLSNKTIALGSNTVSGTKAQFNTAVTDDDIAFVGTANAFTANQSVTGTVTTRAAATQDAVILQGRAGGTTSLGVTLTPTTLTASRTLTLPDTTGTVITTGDTGTITGTMIADGTIVNAEISATAAIAYSKLNLASSIVNADISTTASIAYSKLNLSGSVVNADISASAAIAHSKLANATAGQVLLGTTTTGVITATTVSGDVTITGAGVTAIGSGVIVDADINASAAIADTKLATISTAGKVSNSATTATSANTASAIVARDSSGNFTAGTITATAIATATTYVGTTAVALNRSSANLALTGISSVAMPGSTSGTVTVQPTATAGTTTITLPATTGTVITTGDTGTVTSTMIADGTIVNADINASAAIDLGKLADVSTNAQTASYTLVLGDKNKIVEMNVATANTLTVPLNSSVAFPVGSQINILQTGAGQCTITPATAGVTINGAPGLKMRAQWSYATLIKRATDTWVLVGDISA